VVELSDAVRGSLIASTPRDTLIQLLLTLDPEDLAFLAESLGADVRDAVVLNLVVATLAGVGVPLGLHAAGRDPAHGSSVLLTFITDAMGFFLFLGLASMFLLHAT
jgi:Mg/Co/Ni transporter MgtE